MCVLRVPGRLVNIRERRRRKQELRSPVLPNAGNVITLLQKPVFMLGPTAPGFMTSPQESPSSLPIFPFPVRNPPRLVPAASANGGPPFSACCLGSFKTRYSPTPQHASHQKPSHTCTTTPRSSEGENGRIVESMSDTLSGAL